jgi:hemolysin-activating ACP:hemolysin acyltransferase
MNRQIAQPPSEGIRSNSEVLGEILWLYAHSPRHRGQRLHEIEQYILPAIKYGRHRIYKRDGMPIGYVAIARLAKEVEDAWLRGKHNLLPEDWISGDRLWIMQFVVPFGDTLAVRKKLWWDPELMRKPIWGLRPNKDGKSFHVVQFGKYRFRERGLSRRSDSDSEQPQVRALQAIDDSRDPSLHGRTVNQ